MKKNNTKKTSKFQVKNLKHDFTETKITKYAGLSPIMQYITKTNIGEELNELFPTIMHNSTKFTIVQIIMSVILSSLSGIKRIKRISNFTNDILIMTLLKLKKGINNNAISSRLKELGQAGTNKLHEYLLIKTKYWIKKSNVKEITLDCDSSVKTVYGNQEGAAKGFNSKNKGRKSYHPLIGFISEMKIVANSWFRTGSTYTSNGICEFMKQTAEIIPDCIEKIFFRADSGFFNGKLFDLLEDFKYSYLVKVKLKNLKTLLENQKWEKYKDSENICICSFDYKCKGWKKSREFKAISIITGYHKEDYWGEIIYIPKYYYACYCSDLELDAYDLHEKYKERSTSETWIEQIKSQLLAGSTLTDNFHANDILWQLSILAYNISVIMRVTDNKYWRQEHETFMGWFINIPGKIVNSGRQSILKIYKNYYYKQRWIDFVNLII